MKTKKNDTSFSQADLEALQTQIKTLEEELESFKQIERELFKEVSFRKAVIERAAEGVCVCHAIPIHPYVKFTVWNARMTEITGYTLKEINRKGWYQTMYPDPVNQKKAQERMGQMREGKDLHGEHWEIVRSNGKKCIFSISTALLNTDDGLAHVLGLMLDVTEEAIYRKNLELEVKKLKEIFPICASCKKIRDDKGYWHQVETYIRDHFDAEFSHSICPACTKKLYPEHYDSIYPEENKK